MTVTAHSTPAEAWEAFAAAIAANDVQGAMRAATREAWCGRGDSAQMVYETATEAGFRLSAAGPAWIEGDRAVLPVKIEAPGRSTTLLGLLERRDGSWSVSAGVRDERHASLFLAGVLPAVFEVTDLGSSPEGEQWARARSEELLGVHALPQRNRAVVGLKRMEDGRPVSEWVCLDTSGGEPRELSRSSYPSMGLLLNGIEAPMPAREAPVSDAKAQGLDSEDWKIINTFLIGLTELARTTAPLADKSKTGSVQEVLTESIAQSLEAAGQSGDAAALRQKVAELPPGAGTGTGDRAQPTGLAPVSPDQLEPVRQELQREIDAYRTEKGLDPNAAITDKAFLTEHGQELSGRLLRILANALPQLRPMLQSLSGSGAGPDTSSSSGSPTS